MFCGGLLFIPLATVVVRSLSSSPPLLWSLLLLLLLLLCLAVVVQAVVAGSVDVGLLCPRLKQILLLIGIRLPCVCVNARGEIHRRKIGVWLVL